MSKRIKHIKKRPTRKIALYIVEGKSDEDALKRGLANLYSKIDPEIEVYFCRINDENHNDGGDITCARGVTPKNYKKYLDNLCVEGFLKKNGFYPKDILEIVQIMDTDGAFIPDSHIIQDDTLEVGGSIYTDTEIRTATRDAIIKRNERKRANMEAAEHFSEIRITSKTVPYKAYFFSCNLDHVLSDERNMDSKDKRKKAIEFAKENEDVFAETFLTSPPALKMDYQFSWFFIREGCNSLGRYTNINLLVEDLLKRAQEV